MIKTSAILAVITGLSLAVIKLLLAENLWWPFAIVEYLAAALLFVGAVMAWRSGRVAVLCSGWGFTGGITWSTLVHHLQDRGSPGPVEYGLSLLLVTVVIGIAVSIPLARNPAP